MARKSMWQEFVEAPGSLIPGSCLVRDFCTVCGEAIRILPRDLGHANRCLQCQGHQPPVGRNPAWRHEPSPWRENAVRAMEDG